MARFYSNENIALQLVIALRALGHDVMTSFDAGNANTAVPDADVSAFSANSGRILLTYNRRDFLHLHRSGMHEHAGMVLLTFDPDSHKQAKRIAEAVESIAEVKNQVIRVNRPSA